MVRDPSDTTIRILSHSRPRLYLVDIEGTASPVEFVYKVLFPYARERMAGYVAHHASDLSLQIELKLLAEENRNNQSEGAPVMMGKQISSQDYGEVIRSSTSYLLWLMDHDRKSTALKAIQGKMWAEGYARGDFRGEVFPDVADAFQRWHRSSRIAIYSSGSVEAQMCLFSHSSGGDLTPFIDAYFDTRIGPKTKTESYARIAKQVDVAAPEALFISDSLPELDAAQEAGMSTLLSIRPGNKIIETPHQYRVIHSFDET